MMDPTSPRRRMRHDIGSSISLNKSPKNLTDSPTRSSQKLRLEDSSRNVRNNTREPSTPSGSSKKKLSSSSKTGGGSSRSRKVKRESSFERRRREAAEMAEAAESSLNNSYRMNDDVAWVKQDWKMKRMSNQQRERHPRSSRTSSTSSSHHTSERSPKSSTRKPLTSSSRTNNTSASSTGHRESSRRRRSSIATSATGTGGHSERSSRRSSIVGNSSAAKETRRKHDDRARRERAVRESKQRSKSPNPATRSRARRHQKLDKLAKHQQILGDDFSSSNSEFLNEDLKEVFGSHLLNGGYPGANNSSNDGIDYSCSDDDACSIVSETSTILDELEAKSKRRLMESSSRSLLYPSDSERSLGSSIRSNRSLDVRSLLGGGGDDSDDGGSRCSISSSSHRREKNFDVRSFLEIPTSVIASSSEQNLLDGSDDDDNAFEVDW